MTSFAAFTRYKLDRLRQRLAYQLAQFKKTGDSAWIPSINVTRNSIRDIRRFRHG